MKGAAALKGYRCLIIDELHERSVESDLLLACLHAMLAAGELPTLKLVLMSATAQVERYQTYFKLPGDHVALIRLDLQRLTTAIGEWLETVKVMYLDQVVDKLLSGHANRLQHQSLLQQHKAGSITPVIQVGHAMALLVRDLILHLHSTEPDPDAVILVFLPTYRALLLQHKLLQERAAGGAAAAGRDVDVFALHSSVDIDEALETIQGPRVAGRRRVVLATNCAESSITLPNVKHVVDSCTTNQVYWDAGACREYARVIWASQSAAQQRAGRTGRTCPGTCYRLMNRLAFNTLPKYEASALTLRSLRRESLCLLSSSSKVMAEPVGLLAQALDPPEQDVVVAALDYLQQIGAAKPNHKGKVEPTQIGSFLAALPISLEGGLLLVQGGLQGLTHEAAMLAALSNTTPFPILQPFGADAMRHVKQYSSKNRCSSGLGGQFSHKDSSRSSAVDWVVEVTDSQYVADSKRKLGVANHNSSGTSNSNSSTVNAGMSPSDDSPGGISRSELLLANMAALYAWQQQWSDPQHIRSLESDSDHQQQQQQQQQPKQSEGEAEWCRQHHLLPSSLRAVSELLGVVYGVLHRFRPCIVAHATGPPGYFKNKFAHRCVLQDVNLEQHCSCDQLGSNTMLQPSVCRQLQALLHEVTQGGTAEADARLLQTRLGSIQQHNTSYTTTSSSSSSSNVGTSSGGPVCRYFLAGTCTRGILCPFSHERPLCKFYLSRTGCTYGNDCRFLHGSSNNSSSSYSVDGGSQSEQQEGSCLSFDWIIDSSSGSGGKCSSKKGGRLSAKACSAAAGQPAGQEAYLAELLSQPSSSSTNSNGIVLLGEGDLSFAAALVGARRAAGLDCSCIVATVLEQEVSQLCELYPHSKVPQRLLELREAGVVVRHGVDATRLPLTAGGVHWQGVGHLVWNFPLATSAEVTGVPLPSSVLLVESDEANKVLMGRFFRSAARLLLCFNPNVKVHIALCNDQYGRWGVEQLSRNSFMFLEASKPLDLRSWPNYTPKRGQLDNAFPAERLVVYSFALHLPETVSVTALRHEVIQLQLEHLREQQRVRPLLGQTALWLALHEEQQRQQQEEEDEGGCKVLGLTGVRYREGRVVDDHAEEGLGDVGFSVVSGLGWVSDI